VGERSARHRRGPVPDDDPAAQAVRRLQRQEDALYARYRALREALRLDP